MEYSSHNPFKQQIKTKIKEFATCFSPNKLIDPENDHYELEIKQRKKRSKLSQPMYLPSIPSIDENKEYSCETFLSSSSIKNNKNSYSDLFDW